MQKKLYILTLILLPVAVISADGDFFKQLLSNLNLYQDYYPEEKIYIQTDKTFYKQSESIWYKAWLVNSTDHIPSETSNILYVELLDTKGNVIMKHEHLAVEGTCNGEFVLSENTPGGLYKLVAYTNWMKKQTATVFEKEITVQRVITPRLLLRLEFEKRAYGPGDEVVADLFVTDLLNDKTDGSELTSQVRINGTVVLTLENIVEDGEAKVRFQLPEDLNSTDGILQIVVDDKGIQESITRSIPIVLNSITLNFYPEGGDMVENVRTRVAFQAVNEFGKGADVKGKIVDENHHEVAVFESFHLGMGAVEFTPLPHKRYFASIEQPVIREVVPLPVAKPYGYGLHLEKKDREKLSWRIFSPENTTAYFVGQTGGVVYETNQLELKEGYNNMSISTGNFPAGVAVFTLFDGEGNEVCERLVFINPEKGLNITLETDKTIYQPEEEVKLTVITRDRENNPVQAHIGVAVIDEQLISFADDKQDDILSYLFFLPN